jgi:acyl dehydratase
MEIIGQGFYWQDMKLGRKFQTRGRTVTEADLVNFVALSGMNESLFTDVEYLEHHSLIKGRVVPGALVYVMAEGLLTPALQGTGMAFLHTELDIKGPTFVGDTIRVTVKVIEARAAAQGNRGLVRTLNQIVNQKDAIVMLYRPPRLMRGCPEFDKAKPAQRRR